jgi:hypothetical protein
MKKNPETFVTSLYGNNSPKGRIGKENPTFRIEEYTVIS